MQRIVEYDIESIGSNIRKVKNKNGLVIDVHNTWRYFYILSHRNKLELYQNRVSIYIPQMGQLLVKTSATIILIMLYSLMVFNMHTTKEPYKTNLKKMI